MKFFAHAASALGVTLALGQGAQAQTADGHFSRVPTIAANYYSWMSTEVRDAWMQGFKGAGVRITAVDDFKSRNVYRGNLGDGAFYLRHGEWTRKEANMIAPDATIASHDFSSERTVALARGLNVLNLSYGMMAANGYTSIRWSAQESSIINYAKNGSAVIAKAAGNDAVAVGAANARGMKDYLNASLIGTSTAIFVGALNTNGTVLQPASLASYSNYAGGDARVQSKFLVVGVRGDQTGLYGTSFAAPIVAGYAAVVGSKFRTATPVQITNQLLNTARRDTIAGYSAAVHGRGEASLTRALAPVSIR